MDHNAEEIEKSNHSMIEPMDDDLDDFDFKQIDDFDMNDIDSGMDSSLQNTPCPNVKNAANISPSLSPILLPQRSTTMVHTQHSGDGHEHSVHSAMPSLPPTPISCTVDHAMALSPSVIMHKVIA